MRRRRDVKLLSYERENQVQFGALLSDDRLVNLKLAAPGAEPAQQEKLASARSFLEAGEELSGLARRIVAVAEAGSCPAEALAPLADVRLLAPVPDPRKLIALAGNYREHIREGGRPTFPKEETYPYLFMKPPSTTLLGSGGRIRYARGVQKLDYEGELAVIIGRRGRYLTPETAYDHVAGYTILNDISERSLASKEPPKAEREMNRFFDWLVGKWFDTSAPCGPWLVTRDEIDDPHRLRLQTRVNGETRQEASTGEMIFTIPEIISFVSRVVTLEPGDVISTGTPSGVGSARGTFLRPGDAIEVEIERIGTLRNTVAVE
jgi:2-keto-4-pentenoate hydratase/2-oxohepta-3-ene-1,7-dioic acid hydratase in catechol pathway